MFPNFEEQRQVWEKLLWFRTINREVGLEMDIVFPGCPARPELGCSLKRLREGQFELIVIGGSWEHGRADAILQTIPMRTKIKDRTLKGSKLYQLVQGVNAQRRAQEIADARA